MIRSHLTVNDYGSMKSRTQIDNHLQTCKGFPMMVRHSCNQGVSQRVLDIITVVPTMSYTNRYTASKSKEG